MRDDPARSAAAASLWERLSELVAAGATASELDMTLEAATRLAEAERRQHHERTRRGERAESPFDPPGFLDFAAFDLLDVLSQTYSSDATSSLIDAEEAELADAVAAELGREGQTLLAALASEARAHYHFPSRKPEPLGAAAGAEASALLHWLEDTSLATVDALVLAARLRALLIVVTKQRFGDSHAS